LFHRKLVEILLELHRTERSCVVRFERGAIKKQLILATGVLTHAESNVPAEHLAHVLIKLNLLSRKDLNRVSLFMKGGKSSEEAIVLATGIDPALLFNGVRDQAIMILSSLFAWPECEPHFYDAKGLSPRQCRLQLPLPEALVEAARRAVQDRCLPASCHLGTGPVFAEPQTGLRSSLPLNRNEAFAYTQLMKEPAVVSELRHVIPGGEVTIEELLQCLLLLGFLRQEEAIESASTAAASQDDQTSEQVDELLRRFEVSNFYEILSVPIMAQESEIKSAYYQMARLYHPDRFAGKEHNSELRSRVEKLFTYITGAYSTLSDAAARAVYDESRLKKESIVEATLQGRAAADKDREKMAETLFRAGRAAFRAGEIAKAVDRLRECVWLRPDMARYHFHLAVAQSEVASLRKEAEQHLLKAIELEPMNADNHVQLGKLYLKVNLPNRAEAQFQEALNLDSGHAEALRLLSGRSDGG
jgi:tetratricopeptide (TPR) repeat protein